MAIALDVFVVKPISVFAWWLASGVNRTSFHERATLARCVRAARREGRPVLFASNHLSMFDDPVVPMALFRTGRRAAVELCGLVALAGVAQAAVPQWLAMAAVATYLVFIARFGARKTWWSLGDLFNFSGASALRSKLESGREKRKTGAWRESMLHVADRAIYYFMRTPSVKTVLIDRGPGAAAKADRAQALRRIVEVVARGEPLWIFFEGGRSRVPDQIGASRRGIGDVVLGLRRLGLRPLVVAVHHRGLEQVIPIGSRRWLDRGHHIDVRWRRVEWELDDLEGDAQAIADRVREAVVALQAEWRSVAGRSVSEPSRQEPRAEAR